MGKITVFGFNHTAFVVSDLDRTIGFFQDLLGFELTSRAPRDKMAIQAMTGLTNVDIEVAYLRGFGQWIELIRYKAPADRGKGLPKIYEDGAGHIALAAGAFGLRQIGDIVTIDQGPNRGRKVVYLQSEEGLSVEFIETPR